jgi:hypothetical protein
VGRDALSTDALSADALSVGHLKTLRFFDLPLAALLILLFVALPWLTTSSGPDQITANTSEGEAFYSLSPDRELILSGPLGDTVIAVAKESVRVLSSPCPTKLCIKMGTIKRSGEALACLPNRVVIKLGNSDSINSGDSSGGVDALLR